MATDNSINNAFIKAIGGKPVKQPQRIFAELPDGKIGISAWYSPEVLEMFKAEVLQSGCKILKTETQK